MVLWWIKITAALGCIGVFILSIVMLAHTKGETDPRAIFWFCVAIAAVGAFFLVANIDHNRPRRVRRAKYWVAVRRLRSEAKDRGQLIDATSGHKTRSIIIAVSGQVKLCAVAPETIEGRFKGNK